MQTLQRAPTSEYCRSCGALIRFSELRPGAWAPFEEQGGHVGELHSCVRHIEAKLAKQRAEKEPAQ